MAALAMMARVRPAPSRASPVARTAAARPTAAPRAPHTGTAAPRGPAVSRAVNLNTDISRVAEYKRHENDSGSAEVQIALLSARVTQLTEHLKQNRKDYACQRGLQQVLAKRMKLMKYLFKTDRTAFDRVTSELGIREKLSKAL